MSLSCLRLAERNALLMRMCQKCHCVTLGKSNRTVPACAGDKEWI